MRLLTLVQFAFPVLMAVGGPGIAGDAENERRVYSKARAARDEERYQRHCSLCHG
jgi:hypothetical protein